MWPLSDNNITYSWWQLWKKDTNKQNKCQKTVALMRSQNIAVTDTNLISSKKKTAVKWSNLEHRSPAEAYASVTRDNPFIDDNQIFQTRPKERCSITCKKCRDENFTFRKEALHVQMGWKGLSSLKTKSPKCAYLTD